MFLVFVSVLTVTACSQDEDCELRHTDSLLGLPALKQGTFPENDVTIKLGESYVYAPQVESAGDLYYQWYLNDEDMSTDPRFTFTPQGPTRSKVRLELSNDFGEVILENNVIVSGADYTNGCLILNEGWFGHESGSVSYYNFETNTIEPWVYKNQNFGATLGATSQSATFWNGRLYICSKVNGNLTVVDPKTLYGIKNANLLGSRQAYEFIGLNEQYGIITANGDIHRVDLNSFEVVTISTGNTWAGCGSAVVYQGKLLLNVSGQQLYVLDVDKLSGDLSEYSWSNQFPFTRLDVQTNGGCRFVSGKDGNVYTVESGEGGNNLVRIKPDLTLEKSPMRVDYSPSSFGSYQEASFCGSADGDTFFYIAGGKIYKCNFAEANPDVPFTTYHEAGYEFYGAGIRVNPQTNEVVATYITSDYAKNRIVRFNGVTGEKISEVAFDGYYFPATILFNSSLI